MANGRPAPPGRRNVSSINAGDLIRCVNQTASADTDCSGIHKHVRVPKFIEFVSMDIEGHEADVLSTWPWGLVEVINI